jgi:hypothetical protein
MSTAEEWMAEYQEKNPERWWWKYWRGAIKVKDFFRYDIWHGTRNLWNFFPVVWRWRGWSHEYDYDVFMRAIMLHRRTLERFHSHEGWQFDSAEMKLLITRWELWKESLDPDEEARLWHLIHMTLERSARGWWD